MKTLITILFFVTFISASAQVQEVTSEMKVATIETTIVKGTTFEKVVLEKNDEVARLYKRSNSRVKKELSFSTKANRPKMA
ncbi:hypothetical protein [Pareuzebyella sediminis]|uniref:hypothetical protein n=1 Tax=Pareuzebyella sediminis TaxID=2607998 RepID=UPI0011EC72B2|nr:hypothetical protein [Pareuzebyella sediminis]